MLTRHVDVLCHFVSSEKSLLREMPNEAMAVEFGIAPQK